MSVLRRSLFCAALLLPAAAPAADRITGELFATRSEVIAPHAMAATSHPLATQIALDVMRQGGSAVDAAIAANAALGLMEPTGNGIGGDLFAIVHGPGREPVSFLGSGISPSAATAEIMRAGGEETPDGPRLSLRGPLSMSVPGMVDAYGALLARFGSRPLAAPPDGCWLPSSLPLSPSLDAPRACTVSVACPPTASFGTLIA